MKNQITLNEQKGMRRTNSRNITFHASDFHLIFSSDKVCATFHEKHAWSYASCHRGRWSESHSRGKLLCMDGALYGRCFVWKVVCPEATAMFPSLHFNIYPCNHFSNSHVFRENRSLPLALP